MNFDRGDIPYALQLRERSEIRKTRRLRKKQKYFEVNTADKVPLSLTINFHLRMSNFAPRTNVTSGDNRFDNRVSLWSRSYDHSLHSKVGKQGSCTNCGPGSTQPVGGM